MYDVIIAGAGIVGLATGLKILEKQPGTKLLIIEKEAGIARHQTGHNSGVIHSGIYYKPGSLKATNCITGYKQLLEFCDKESIPYNICGKVIVATDESELPYLETLYERGIANGLTNIRKISKEELKEFEPHAYGIKAIHVPYTGIIDYKVVTEKYAKNIILNGGEITLLEKVIGLYDSGNAIEVDTDKQSYKCHVFVNCAGLYSDRIYRQNNDDSSVRIIPFRGEYYKIKEEKQYLVNTLIYPVPNPDFPFLGVHFTRMIEGGVEAGPNAVLAFKLEGYNKSDINLFDLYRIFSWKGFRKVARKYIKVGMGEFKRSYSKRAFVKALQKLLPEIQKEDLVKGGSGVRAQAIGRDGRMIDDFVIKQSGNIINVLNAPSPAATSSLAIGDTISDYVVKQI
ncbi:MAG: L-2-hydroxyglutarate oxidase [Ignavibacteriae bacterium]|nr:MAG: L-2-hydroxyglutarate oxidase [Ignavibacteriota bacterium]